MPQFPSLGSWLDGAHTHLRDAAPELAALVADYVGEAQFGAEIIAQELATLSPGAAVLEVGAGTMLLSCALQAAGFAVTAVEPVGAGFSHMTTLRGLVLDYARSRGEVPALEFVAAEQLEFVERFDFAFSINVMEHVDDVEQVLQRVWHALRPGGTYRFVCPNYTFPFEPHFGIPTLGTKALTWRWLQKRILASRVVVDPVGTWNSLNWITVAQVRRVCRQFGVVPRFDGDVTHRYVQRAIGDPTFQRRHGVAMRAMATTLGATGLLALVRLMPAAIQPAMSCQMTRPV
jgi:SAM-dependent methyltransferase